MTSQKAAIITDSGWVLTSSEENRNIQRPLACVTGFQRSFACGKLVYFLLGIQNDIGNQFAFLDVAKSYEREGEYMILETKRDLQQEFAFSF